LKNHRGGEQRKHAGVFIFHSERRGRVIYAKPFHIPPLPVEIARIPRAARTVPLAAFSPDAPIFKFPKSVFQARKIDRFSEFAKGYLILKSHL